MNATHQSQAAQAAVSRFVFTLVVSLLVGQALPALAHYLTTAQVALPASSLGYFLLGLAIAIVLAVEEYFRTHQQLLQDLIADFEDAHDQALAVEGGIVPAEQDPVGHALGLAAADDGSKVTRAQESILPPATPDAPPPHA
ncbi:MAG: hypothetical protein KGJ86_10245 [Chloroflexota bacterium]|nr:hypothetical protein [Chloroflexota bacterium]